MILVLSHLARLSGSDSLRRTGRGGMETRDGRPDYRMETFLKSRRQEDEQATQRVCAASLLRAPDSNVPCRRSVTAELAIGHLLGHVQDEFTIPFVHFAQQAAKLVEKACIFTDAAPGDVIRRLTLGEIRQLRRFLTVIKELIEWALE